MLRRFGMPVVDWVLEKGIVDPFVLHFKFGHHRTGIWVAEITSGPQNLRHMSPM